MSKKAGGLTRYKVERHVTFKIVDRLTGRVVTESRDPKAAEQEEQRLNLENFFEEIRQALSWPSR